MINIHICDFTKLDASDYIWNRENLFVGTYSAVTQLNMFGYEYAKRLHNLWVLTPTIKSERAQITFGIPDVDQSAHCVVISNIFDVTPFNRLDEVTIASFFSQLMTCPPEFLFVDSGSSEKIEDRVLWMTPLGKKFMELLFKQV